MTREQSDYEFDLVNPYQENTSVSMGTSGKIAPNTGVKFKKILIKLDIETLDLLLAYAYNTDSQYITRSAMSNIHTWISMMNLNFYKNNQSLRARIDLLLHMIDARLFMGFENKKLIMNYAIEKSDFKELVKEEIYPELKKIRLNSRAVQYLNSYVADRLIHAYIYAYKDELLRLCGDLEAENYGSLAEIIKAFKELITNLLFDIRNSENYSEDNMTFDLSDGNFENVVLNVVKKLKSPNNKLVSGIQALNAMLNGGFEQRRSYLFFGITGVGKSVLLLNILIFLKMYNKIRQKKDQSKRPCVLYISQENTIDETIERIFNMQVTGSNIRDYTPSEVAKLLRTKGQLTLETEDDIDIVVKYYDDKEISTMDIYSIVGDIEDTGREVIALLHDYIERIKSSKGHSELRLELAEIANDYSVIAKRLCIPVIGAGQLNRKAADVIDSNTEANKFDIGRLLGKGYISEAFAILKNIDGAVVVNREIDSDGNEYMTFLDMKQRSKNDHGKKNKFAKYFAHPFDPENGIKLIPDVDLDEPLSKTTLDDIEQEVAVVKRGGKRREAKELPINKPSKETVETIEMDDVKDFRFLEDVIKNRKKNRIKEIDDEKVDSKFENIFEQYANTHYVRNDSGYIDIVTLQGWTDF